MLHQTFRSLSPVMSLLSVMICVGSEIGSAIAEPPSVLKNARLIDGLGGPAREKIDLLIENGRIKSITPAGEITYPPSCVSYDYSGKTMIPGLISVHSHVGQYDGVKSEPAAFNQKNIIRQLQQYQAYGMTTVAALGLNRPEFYAIRRHLRAGELNGADLLGADRGIGVMSGAPALGPDKIAGDQLDRPETVEQVRASVRAAKERGADLIKIWCDDGLGQLPRMKQDILAAAVDEAHLHGLKIASHIYSLADAKEAVKAGVDIIAHGVRDQPVDEEFIELLKARSVWYVPTIVLDESFYAYADQADWTLSEFAKHAFQPALVQQFANAEWREQTLKASATATRRMNVEMNKRNAALLHDAGVKLALGTDSGASCERVPGLSEHRELMLLASAGIEPQELLQIATRNSAAALGLDDRGILVSGKLADVVVVEGNPLEDLVSLQKIVAVWHGGKLVSGPLTDFQP